LFKDFRNKKSAAIAGYAIGSGDNESPPKSRDFENYSNTSFQTQKGRSISIIETNRPLAWVKLTARF